MWGVYTHLLQDGYKESVVLGIFFPQKVFGSLSALQSHRAAMTSRSLNPSSGHSGEVPAANDLDSEWHLWGAMLCPKTWQVQCSSDCCPEQSMCPEVGTGLPARDETLGTMCAGAFNACWSAHTEERGDMGCKQTCCATCLWCTLFAASSTSVQWRVLCKGCF